VQSVVSPIRRTGNVVMLWDSCPPVNYEAALLPIEDNYSPYGGDSPETRVPLLGDLVMLIPTTGRIRRYSLTGTDGGSDSKQLPYGIVIGTAMNPIGYSAFGGEYYNNLTQRPHALVATIGIGTELFMYRIRVASSAGQYLNPDESISGEQPIQIGDPVRIRYVSNVGRWGVVKAVPPAGGAVDVHGEVIGYVSRPKIEGITGLVSFGNLVGLHIRLVRPYTLTP